MVLAAIKNTFLTLINKPAEVFDSFLAPLDITQYERDCCGGKCRLAAYGTDCGTRK